MLDALVQVYLLHSEDVISKLIKEQQTGQDWSINLFSSGDDEKRLILHSFPVCFAFINLLITSSLCNTLGLMSSV